jgi:hypothetical protein
LESDESEIEELEIDESEAEEPETETEECPNCSFMVKKGVECPFCSKPDPETEEVTKVAESEIDEALEAETLPPLDIDEPRTSPLIDKKVTKRNLRVNLMGVVCIFIISVYLMYISALSMYVSFFIDVNIIQFCASIVIFLLSFWAFYGGITVAKNSIVYDHFLDSLFENEVYPRLEPAMEEVAEIQARLDQIDGRMERMSLNIARQKQHPPLEAAPLAAIDGKISMFLKFIVIINLTIGILLYALSFPGRYAPYIFTLIFILWWLVITEEYKLWKSPIAWVWAILPIFTVPVMAILLYYVISIGVLIGLIGVFLTVYAYTYYAWARYHVEGMLPFGLHEGELET